MCGRYRFTSDMETLMAAFGSLIAKRILIEPRWNMAPTQLAPVVVQPGESQEMEMMRWGLVPSWSKDTKAASKCINARSESAAEKPSFRSAFKHRRCLVPAHGYYEWTGAPGGRKQPWHFGLRGEGLMCFAGLWESWTPPEQRDVPDPPAPLHTYTILTTTPNELAARWHDRMPVILPQQSWAEWLNPGAKPAELQSLLKPGDAGNMEAWPVTPRMNTVRFESPECAKPISENDEFNLSAD